MDRILYLLVGVAILSLGFAYFFLNNTNINRNTYPSPTAVKIPNCLVIDLETKLSLDHAAGNVYGELTLKNTSKKACQITGSNFITVAYDQKNLKNISIEHQGKLEKNIFILNPNQVLYSQVHYPNGPQCNGETMIAKVQFMYTISQDTNITFVDLQNNKDQNIQICKSSADLTTIQVWNISSTPITP